MVNSLISIIVPIYNSEKYLNKCLDSLINQTYKNIEIICVNDGSEDGSLKILKEYKLKDNRIKIITTKNRGSNAARNLGIKNSTGVYIIFVDSNDYVNLEFCENLLVICTEVYTDLVCSKKFILDCEDNEIDNYFSKNNDITGKMFKSNIIKKYKLQFDTNINYAEKSLFLKQYMARCKNVTYSEGSNYITHKTEITADKRPKKRKKQNQPLVSIILTLYEIEPEYLNECLQSLLNQTYKNIEIIAINDCSPKTNYDYITKMSDKIKLYKNEVNLGMNKTVNKAFQLANGKYIMRLGSDDYFSSNLVEKEVSVLESEPEVGAVCCELRRFGRRLQYIRRPKEWNLKSILDGNYRGAGYAGGMMFRATLLEECTINENYRMCEDFDFHLQILERMPIKSIHETMYFYRSHETNLCKTVSDEKRIGYLNQILEEHKAIYNQKHPDE